MALKIIEEPKFQCSKCGACCKRAGKLGLMPQREDGACIHLDHDNTCKIYETRPDFCRVKRRENVPDDMKMTDIEYFKIANGICNQWIKEDGLDEKYLINLEAYDTGSSTT